MLTRSSNPNIIATGKPAAFLFGGIVFLGFLPFLYFAASIFIDSRHSIKLDDLVKLCTVKVYNATKAKNPISLDFFTYLTHTRYGSKNKYGKSGVTKEQLYVNTKEYKLMRELEPGPILDAFNALDYQIRLQRQGKATLLKGQCKYNSAEHTVTLLPNELNK